MGLYLVTYENLGNDKYYILEAKNKKEAIDKVYNTHFLPFVEDDKKAGYKPVYKNQLLCNDILKETKNGKIFWF